MTANSTSAGPGARRGTTGRQGVLALLLAALAAGAWLALAWWSAGPYARFVSHGGWTDAATFAELCRAVPEGEVVVPALLHAFAWLLMIAAMMLPTTLPVLAMFLRVAGGRPDRVRLTLGVVAGYCVAWMGFGLAAHATDGALHAMLAGNPAVAAHAWAIGAVVLAGAGAFQFSALKYRCLEQCHTPFAFVAARWHGKAPAREAFRLGLEHGLFCIGCCWALMLLMFVVGTGSLALMLALALVMAAEKNLPWGRRLRLPLGVALFAGAAAVVAANA
jgi:predicted metal-binding membrane protein